MGLQIAFMSLYQLVPVRSGTNIPIKGTNLIVEIPQASNENFIVVLGNC